MLDQKWSYLRRIAAAIMVAAVAACAGDRGQETVPPPPPVAAALPGPIIAEELVQGEATVVSVDRATRQVTLRADDGRTTTITPPEEFDLTRVKPMDRVNIAIYQSVELQVLPAGSAVPDITSERGTAVAPPGEMPGRVVAQQITITAEIAAIDLATSTVTLRGPQGGLRNVTVKNPEMQARLGNLRVGELVQATVTEAFAAQLVPPQR